MKRIICASLLFLATTVLSAGEGKRVLVLDFVNADKNPNYQYLEVSLTDAVRKKLKERFVFREDDREHLKKSAEANFFFKDDYASRSVAMNIGLLTRQDVVIAASYRLEKVAVADTKKKKAKKKKRRKKKKRKKKTKKVEQVVTTIRILDVARKRELVVFEERSLADSSIFTSVDRIAGRVADEAKAVLPTKEQWERGEYESKDSGRVVENILLYAAIGDGLFMLDYSQRIKALRPGFRFGLRANLPLITPGLTIEAQNVLFNEESLSKNKKLKNIDVETANYIPGLYFGYTFKLGRLEIHPRLGGGYTLQTITVSGNYEAELSNSMPYAGAGLDFSYPILSNIDATLAWETMVQFQEGETLFNMATLGVRLRL